MGMQGMVVNNFPWVGYMDSHHDSIEILQSYEIL